MSGEPLTLEQTKRAAAQLCLHPVFHSVDPIEDVNGRGVRHMLWMLLKVVVLDPDMTLDKANRWLGYVQGWLVASLHAELEDVKNNIRKAR